MKMVSESPVRFLVVSPRYVSTVASRFAGQSLEWCYFGTRFERRQKVAQVLTAACSMDIAEMLNRVARDAKQPFLDWMAEIGSRQADRLNWWSSQIASKSPLQTDFFLLVCYHKLFRSWVSAGQSLRIRVIVVEDPWLRVLLKNDFSTLPTVMFLDSRLNVVADAAYWLGRAPVAVTYVAFLHTWRKVVASLAYLHSRLHEGGGNSKGASVFLYTWIEKSCFKSPDKLQDVYTGRLEEILGKNGKSVTRMTSFSVPSRFLLKLRPFLGNLLLTPRYVTMYDILKAALSFFRITDLRTLPALDGATYRPLFYRELLREWGSPRYATCRLSFLSFRRLAQRHAARLESLIYPFENQPWEKMLCLAFKQEAPGVRIIGYQHASVPALLLSYALGKGESSFTPLPDVIVTNGHVTLNQLQHDGFPAERLVNGGALRFEYLFRTRFKKEQSNKKTTSPYCILVAFPIIRPPAVCLLQDLLALFATPALGTDGLSVKFVLKCHPDLPWKMLGANRSKLPPWFTVSEEPLHELLARADLFLYAPPTGTWREACQAGLPVLKYCGEFLDLDFSEIDALKRLPVSSRDTLKTRMCSLLTQGHLSATLQHDDLLRDAFSPVNEEAWMQVVGTSRQLRSAVAVS